MIDLAFMARVQHILVESVAALPEEDQVERLRWCTEHNAYGIRAFPEADCIRFEWGGRLLAVVDREAFTDDAYLRPLAVDLVGEVPDDLRSLDGGPA